MVAAQLKRKQPNLSIAVIEPSNDHWYQPAWTLVAAGTYDYAKTRRDESSLIPPGVTWIKDAAKTFEPQQNTVETALGDRFSYDYLVVCPGLVMDIDALPGLRGAMQTEAVCSNYVDPNKTWRLLQRFKGGNAVFTQPTTPIKCGGAPQKIMYLADDYFRKSSVRKNSNVIFATPGTVIFGTKEFAETLNKIIARKDIIVKFFYAPVRIDSDNREIHFKYTGSADWQATAVIREAMGSDGLVKLPYDLLHLAPPQAAPAFVRTSPLAAPDGPSKGWIPVGQHTLQHQDFSNIYALGDVAALPTAKTGAAIRKQAPVVVDHILAAINGTESDSQYNGYSSCPLITGYGKMLLAEFKYGNVRDSDPLISRFIDTSKEQWSMWLLKKYGLPYLYWHRMMKGKM